MLIFIEDLNSIEIIDQEKSREYSHPNLVVPEKAVEDQKELCKAFKAFIFSIRSNVYNYAPTGWSIVEEPESTWLES